MAGIKRLNTRIINKHATASIWNDSTFVPLQGEIVIYDPSYDATDGKTYTRERMKIGDGSHTVKQLPFVNELDVTTTKEKKTATLVTSVGTPEYISASYQAPSMSQDFEEDTLTITFDAGSYTPAQFSAGETAETTTITYVEDITIETKQPI